jgi:hypothetical protein
MGMRKQKFIYAPYHPSAYTNGRILESRYLAERALNKGLPLNSEVHHFTDTQLVICEDAKYHHLLHRRERAFKETGHKDYVRCTQCCTYVDPNLMSDKKRCKPCALERSRILYPKRREYLIRKTIENHQRNRERYNAYMRKWRLAKKQQVASNA